MTDINDLIKHIDRYDRACRRAAQNRTAPPERAVFLSELEQLWQQTGDEKFSDPWGGIITGRLIEEYAEEQNREKTQYWLDISDQHENSRRHPESVRQHYRADALIRCGATDAALAALQACHADDPAYIAEHGSHDVRAFWLHHGHPDAAEAENLAASLALDEDFDGASATIVLPAWTAFFQLPADEEEISLVFFGENGECSEDEDYAPTAAQHAAVAALREQQSGILQTILAALFERYPAWREQYAAHYDPDEAAEILPELAATDGLADLICPVCIYILAADENGGIPVGIGFHCEWDAEHGLGVLIADGKVAAVGGEETAFYGV
jgi:hypothetical protein